MSKDDRLADLGVSQLEALLDSDLLDDTEKVFVEAALDTVYEDPEAELDELGDDAEAVQYVEGVEPTPEGVTPPANDTGPVPSQKQAESGGPRDG